MVPPTENPKKALCHNEQACPRIVQQAWWLMCGLMWFGFCRLLSGKGLRLRWRPPGRQRRRCGGAAGKPAPPPASEEKMAGCPVGMNPPAWIPAHRAFRLTRHIIRPAQTTVILIKTTVRLAQTTVILVQTTIRLAQTTVILDQTTVRPAQTTIILDQTTVRL